MDLTSLHKELTFRTSRSSGSGGQHVNKTETRVELLFDVAASGALTEEQKDLIRQRLASRITKEGILLIVNQASRSQAANKEGAIATFDALLRQALQPRPRRKKTHPPKGADEQRLRAKRQHAEKKGMRGKVRLA